MRKVLPLLLAVLVFGTDGPSAFACGRPPLPALVAMSEYVALVRVVGTSEVHEVRVTEYEVTRAFKGTPPARFVMIGTIWGTEDEEVRDEPQPTDSAILFLRTDAIVQAPWKDWEEVARSTRGLPVLDAFGAEPVLLWRGVTGVANVDAEMLMNVLIQAVAPDAAHAHGVVPLETYFETLAAAVEEAKTLPPAEEGEPLTTER